MKFGRGAQPNALAIESNCGIVLLARYNSRRLPGKALRLIQGKPTLDHVLARLELVVPRDQIILATSNEASDQPLAEYAQSRGLACYRGSLERVGERFFAAAEVLGFPYAARINGDNIFLDAEVLQTLLKETESGQYDFLSNVKGRTFPRGMSVEIVRLDYYRTFLPQISANAHFNEHVMVCLYAQDEAGDRHYYLQNTQCPEAAGLQLALDTAEDLKRSQWILAHLPPGEPGSLSQITSLALAYDRDIEG